MQIIDFLESAGVSFTVHHHEPTDSALDRAALFHGTQTQAVKPVLLKVDGTFAVALIAASSRISLLKVRQALRAGRCGFATEADAINLFVDCDPGVINAFGSQYSLTTLIDKHLTRALHLLFPGNRQSESIHLSLQDFEKLERPKVVDVCRNFSRSPDPADIPSEGLPTGPGNPK